MCIKLDENELDTMKDILTMALNAVIAECLNLAVDRVHPGSRLVADLGMSPLAKKRLQREIAFIFDCTELNMPDAMKVEELVDQVANIEFSRLEPNLPAQAAWYINPFRANARQR
jgi:hypothetical protein